MIKYTCSHCGSENVTWDANAQWSFSLQRFILTGTSDNTVCEGSVTEVYERIPKVEEEDY